MHCPTQAAAPKDCRLRLLVCIGQGDAQNHSTGTVFAFSLVPATQAFGFDPKVETYHAV